MLSMSSLNMLLAKNDFLPSPLKETYVVSRFLSLLLWFRMPQDLLDLIEMRQRVLNPLNEEFSIFMELLGYLCIKEEEREFQKCSFFSVQFNSVAQSCSTLCYSIYCSKPGLSVHHQLPEFTQTHVHWVGDAIQSSHPLLSPSPPAFNFFQHQCLF